MSVLLCTSLAAYINNVNLNRISLTASYSKSSQRGARMTEWDYRPPLPPVYTPVEKLFMKKGQKQVKKNAFTINSNIEDVGLNED